MAAKRPPLAQRVAGNSPGARALLKKALANPGLRSKLSDTQLRKADPKLYAQRQMNTRLSAKITPGSNITERELAQQSKAATDVKYGALEAQQRRQAGEAQNWQRDIGSYYDDYLRQVAQHAQNVRDIGAQTVGQLQGVQQGVTGLSAADLTQLNQKATADAAARGATPGDLSQMASNATAVRQALVGSFAAQQAARGAASSNYASNYAGTVAPTQKLQAVAQAAGKVREAREKQAETAKERGAYDVKYRAEQRADEAKTQTALQIASGKSAAELARERLQANTSVKTAKIRAGATLTAAQIRAEQQKADRDARAGVPNKYGIPASEWNSMTTAQRQKTIKDFAARGGKSGGGKPKLTSGDWTTQLTSARDLATRAQQGRKFEEPAGQEGRKDPRARLDRHAAAMKILSYGGTKLKDPVIASAGADAVYLGFLSQNSINQLQAAGLSAKRASELLGVPTWRQYKKTHPGGSRGDVAGGRVS